MDPEPPSACTSVPRKDTPWENRATPRGGDRARRDDAMNRSRSGFRLVSTPMMAAVPSVATLVTPPDEVTALPHHRNWTHHWAREVIRRHGSGTLDYFALGDDKRHFSSVSRWWPIACSAGFCLATPDPIGPVAERELVWSSFRRFTAGRGWTIAVLGASAYWLPIYAEGSMRALYIGDEAVVDATEFHLAGGRRKGLRQAYNRIERNGYTATFHDPTEIPRPPRGRRARGDASGPGRW